MGGFAQGLGQGIQGSQQYLADIQNRRQQAELFALKSKQLKLETDMQEKQLAAQNALPELLFKPPQQRQVTVQGPGAPQLPEDQAGLLAGYSPAELDKAGGAEGVLKQYATEGPQPTGMADIAGTEGPWAKLSPELQNVAKSILTSTGGDLPKTMQTLQMLAPGVFPKQPFMEKLKKDEDLVQVDPANNTSRVVAKGEPSRTPPHVVGGALVDDSGKVIYKGDEKPGKPKDDIVEVGGKAYQVSEQNGQKVLLPLPGQEDKEAKSPVNPVDQYIYAQSGGKYHNMAEAAKAGETDLIKQAERVVREQRPLDRAEAMAGVMTKEAAVRERTAQDIKLEKPLAQEKRANLFDRKAFLEGKIVRLPPGTSEGAAAKADVIEITDKQMAEIQTLDNATSDMGTLFSMADKLITAKDWKEASFKQFPALKGGAFTGMNSDAATYEKDVQAFSTNLARAFGHEKGVMTDQDIARWVATIPTFRDTVKTKESKKAIFNEIKDNAIRAQRRAIAGDDLNAVRSELQQKVQPLLKKADSIGSRNEVPPVPEKFRHLPKEDQERWQQAYMERLQEVGANQ